MDGLLAGVELLLSKVLGLLGGVDRVAPDPLLPGEESELEPATELVSDDIPEPERRLPELFIAEPLWRDAGDPAAVPLLSGAELISPVSFLEHPTNAIRLAAKSANFFIFYPSIPGCRKPLELSAPDSGSP